MFVNPWTYYIVNDEMPDIRTFGLGDKFRNRVLWSLLYAFVVCFLWAIVVVLGSKYLIGYDSEHYMLKFCLLIFPSLALMVFLIIFGMNKILNVNEKEKVKENNNFSVMKNEEKANNIIIGIPQHPYHITYEEVIENFTTDQLEECLLDMAEWKDQQYDEEKKQLIDKAADYIYTHAHVTTFGDIRLDKCSMTQFVNDFKKAMEGNNDGFLD